MERGKFEDSWRDAFEKAGISPSEKVWTNIELDLEKEKGGVLRKRLRFYQMLAAASVVFALAIAGTGVYYNFTPDNGVNTLAANEPAPSDIAPRTAHEQDQFSEAETLEVTPAPGDVTISEKNNVSAPLKRAAPQERDETTLTGTFTPEGSVSEAQNSGDAPIGLAEQNEMLFGRALPHSIDDRALAPLYTPKRVALVIPSQEEQVDPVQQMLARLEQREREVQGEQKNNRGKGSEENLWTSIGFAAGSFNGIQSSSPSPAPTTTAAMALAAPIVDQETKASGYSYSMGVNVGTRLSERWVLQGGVNYLTHASEYTANNVVVSNTNFHQQRFRAASTNELVNADAQELSNKIVYSAPYSVNNSMRYLSIPLQAGYLIVNKTVGVQLNAGVATDLFLQNTVTPDSDQMDKTTQAVGSDSPYRAFNLSGLVGTEVSYRFGQHYRISLNPGLRYPFSTIYKSELGVEATPLTFDVGLRFRYIFH